MKDELLQAKLDALPPRPGVYVFRDEQGAALYVGKASSLRNRVRSYFQAGSSDARYFIPSLVAQLADLETIVVGTEKEAALLENQLIKEYRPHYNVKLRDDKEYLSLRLDTGRPWPRLEVVRKPKADGARYFGPYSSASGARKTLRTVNRHFQLRTCTDSEMKARKRPCLQYQIKRCPAPCVLEVPRDRYDEQVHNVALFLDGRHDELREELETKMGAASEAMEYELAAVHRDQLRAIERVHEEQRVSKVSKVDQDVIGLFRQADQAEIAVLRVRRGRVVSLHTFGLQDVSLPDEEIVASFMATFYSEGTYLPHEILLPTAIDAMEGLAELLSERRGTLVTLVSPKRGPRRALVAMADDNAMHAFEEKQRVREDIERRLTDVQTRLRLPRLPRRIECLDISHHGGEDTVGVFAALSDGQIDRSRYRSFTVRRARGGDDFGAMHEVLSRRFLRSKGPSGGWEAPDLLVVDGGKGQLSVALSVLSDLQISEVPVVALAKEKETLLGEQVVDRVYLPGTKNPVLLRDSSPALQMLALVRDEAHRSSNELRKKVGKRRSLHSELDAIPGVGPKTRARLLRHFGSVRAIRTANRASLLEAGATRRQAEDILAALGEAPSPEPVLDAERDAVDNAFSEGSGEP